LKIFKEGLNDSLLDVLYRFQKEPLFKEFHLVGGTALTLLIGHRVSDDIDLFTKEKLNKDKIFRYCQNFQKDVEIINDDDTIYQLYFPQIKLKIDFVQYPFKLLDPIINTDDGLHILGKNDISAMKMSAAGTRGYEAKDFVDLYFLLKDITFDNIVENFRKKYENNNPLHYIRSMAFFDDITLDSWDNIKYLSNPVSSNIIKFTLSNCVKDYEKKQLSMENNIENIF
jgi:hypothetical protein